nr:MAG: hypothetical protein [Botourmiaviridae sp.]
MRGTGCRKPGNQPAPPAKSVTGRGGAVSCKTCKKVKLDTERMIASGLRVIRLRFGVHRSELPDLGAQGLKIYLLSLLNPGESIVKFSDGRLRGFPRSGYGFDEDGFPRLRRLGRSDRWELAHSCNSLARSLPPVCAIHAISKIDDWIATATTPSPAPPADYLKFVRKTVSRLFPLGWDKHRYPQSVHSFSPKSSARAETASGCGGSPADAFWSGRLSDFTSGHPLHRSTKAPFSTFCLTGRWGPQPCPPGSCRSSPYLCSHCKLVEEAECFGRDGPEDLPYPGGFFLRVKDIPTVGKTRVIGIPSLNYDVLGPMHRAIYGHLCTRDFLMHGTVNSRRIQEVCVGDTQTSVDLTNATDGLNLGVTEAILGTILRKSVAIPGRLQVAAFDSLRPSIFKRSMKGGLYPYHDFNMGRVSHGQMMGTYLSFPLLCLHSYCAASWAARKSRCRGILVNGDDTIISHDSPLGEYPPGYELNRMKTLSSRVTCELNSTVFTLRAGLWKEVRSLRRFGADLDFKGYQHMAGACQKASPSWVTAFMRSRLGKSWALSAKDLGLSPSHRLVWLRDRRKRGAISNVRFPSLPPDERYELVTERPTIADQVAFGIDLFDNGRSEPPDLGEDPSVWNPSRTAVLKSCPRPRPVRRSCSGRVFESEHSYEFSRDVLRLSPTPVRNWCVLSPDRYWAQSPRREEVFPEESGRYILSPCAPPPSDTPVRPLLEGMTRALGTEWEQVDKIRRFETGCQRWTIVTPSEVYRSMFRTAAGVGETCAR